MGCFTWTDARKLAKQKWDYDYPNKDKVGYGGYVKVVCPDNTEIIEKYYDGYGMFDGRDIYELVVDWNKKYLEDIFKHIATNPTSDKYRFGYRYKDIAIAYQNNDETALKAAIEKLITEGKAGEYLRKEWKREIGIAINCDSKLSDIIVPFPIKVTTKKWHVKYDDLYPSFSCQ